MRTSLFALTLVSLAALLAAPPASAALKLKSEGKDQNFLYEQDPKALASTVQLVFRTGNLADPHGKEGLASLAFDALFRGTKKLDRADFFAAVERLGANIDADTASNRTIVSLDALSDNLEPAVQLLAEAVLHPALKDDEINSLKQEHLDSLSQELANNRAVMKRVARQAIFRGTPLAFPPSGTETGLKAITPDDVRKFLAEQVKTGNVVLAVASNRDESAVRGWVEKAFAEFPEGNAPKTPALEFQPIQGRNLYVVDRAGSSTTEMGIAQRSYAADYPERETVEAGLEIFGGSDMSGRLFRALRAEKGWTYGAYALTSFLEIPRRWGGSMFIYAFPQADHTADTVLTALKLFETYVQKGIEAKELRFTQLSQANAYPFKFATARSRLTARLYHFLDGAPLLTVPEFRRKMESLTREKVRKAVQKVEDPANLAIVLVGDPGQTEALKKSIPNLKSVRVVKDPQAELQ